MKNNLIAWDIAETDFPSQGSINDKLKFLISYAILAPSGHNTQPWLFKLSEYSIRIFADRTRALPVIDPDDRELIISCGAALCNILVSAKYFGMNLDVKYFPVDGDMDLLAELSYTGETERTELDEKLFGAIVKRHTNRLPFAEQEIDGLILQKFETIASEEKVTLKVVYNEEIKEEIIKLIEKGDRLQAQNKSFCRELAQWVHPNRSNTSDGIPGYAFGMGDLISYTGPFFIGNLDWGNIQAGRDRNLVVGSPVLGVFESNDDKPEDWIAVGVALERLLLTAASEGIAASYLNQPVEVPELKEQLKNILKINGYPQLIMRLGYGKEVKPTPRRNIEDVILKDS